MPQLRFDAVEVLEASVAAQHLAAALAVLNGNDGHFGEEKFAFGHGSSREHAFAFPGGMVADFQGWGQIGAGPQGCVVAVGVIGAR